MSGINKRIHIIPTSLDEDRLEGIFEIRPDRVYILYNGDPIEKHEDIAEDTKENAVEIAEKHVPNGDIEPRGIDFYHFKEALTDIYRIFYREKLRENDVFINLSGGTKPVAVALAFTCSLTNSGEPYYYAAEEYSTEDGNVKTSGMVEERYELPQLTSIDFSNTIPDNEQKQNMIRWLLKSEDRIGVTEMLKNAQEINQDNPDFELDRNRYYGHTDPLVERGLLEKHDNSKYDLTPAGRLVGRLLVVQKQVKEELEDERAEGP